MTFIKKQKLTLSFFIFLISVFFLKLVSANSLEDELPLTASQIMGKLTSLEYKEAKAFSQKLTEAKNKVSEKLTQGWPETQQLSHNSRSRFLRLMDDDMESKGFKGAVLFQTGDVDITFGVMLKFCEDLTITDWSTSCSSFSSNSSGEKELKLLGRKNFSQNDVGKTLRKLRKSLEYSFPLCFASVLEFKKKYQSLLDKTRALAADESEKKTFHQKVADALLGMNEGEVEKFCKEYDYYCFHANRTYFGLGPNQCGTEHSYFRHFPLKDLTRSVLSAFKGGDDEESEIKKLKDFELLKIEEVPLTLERYLRFWLEMHPKYRHEEGTPFVSETRYIHIEKILETLQLNSEAQQGRKIRNKVESLQKTPLADPFYMPPATISALKENHRKLVTAVENFSYSKPVDIRIGEHVGKHPIVYGTVGTAALLTVFGLFGVS